MFTILCQSCNAEIIAQRSTKRFCDNCKAKRNSAIPRNKEKRRRIGIKWAEENRERRNELARRSYRKNAEKIKERNKPRRAESRAKYPGKYNAYLAEYYQNNKEYFAENSKRWIAQHPEAYKASRNQGNHRRRARVAQAEGEWTFEEFTKLCEASDNRCYYCQKQTDKLTADHMIPLSRGGTNWIENIVPACLSCNSGKCAKTPLEYCFPVRR